MVVVMKKVSENYEKNSKMARKELKGELILDISVDGGMGFLSPEFYWGGIVIPGMRVKGRSVMGIYESLKIFKNRKEVDLKYCLEEKYDGKKRGCKSYGKLEGLRWDGELVSVDEGIEKIKGMYVEEIKRRYSKVIESLREISKKKKVVLLENEDVDGRFPFSYGEVIKELIES